MGNSLSCFKAYDIRGRVPGVLNAPLARALGRAVVEILGAKSVVIVVMPGFPAPSCEMRWPWAYVKPGRR